jgi:hypothetical protein
MEEIAADQDKRPEPYATVLDLVNEHGRWAVIEALANDAEFESEDQNLCLTYREEAAWLHMELNQLLARYELLFLESEPEPVVSHEGSELVQ